VLILCTTLAEVGRSAQGSATEDFVANFETGPPGWKQFTGLQYEQDRPLEESFSLVDQPVRSGLHAARITVRHGYSRFGHNEGTLLAQRSDESPGEDYWYAFSVYFPEDWFAPYKWGIFAQWHARLGTSPVIALNARADTATLNFHAGLTDEQRNSFQYNINRPLLPTLSKAHWNDFVVHVRWSTGRDGEVEVWHKLGWQHRLRRLVRLANVPTFQWTTSGTGVGIYFLFGLYRGSHCGQPTNLGCTSPLGEQAANVLYVDSYARASSFDAVKEAAFPGERMLLCVPARRGKLFCGDPLRRSE
jgi:hypothetical protein